MAKSPSHRPAYACGAIAAMTALGAFVAGTFVTSAVITQRYQEAEAPNPAFADQAHGGESEEADSDTTAAADPESTEGGDVAPVAGEEGQQGRGIDAFSPAQFIFMVIGALIAYELGRSASGPPVPTSEPGVKVE